MTVQSSDTDRTIQSAYAEMLGFTYDGNFSMLPDFKLSRKQYIDMTTITQDSPSRLVPFSVRNGSVVNSELGFNPAPDGFSIVPIYTYIKQPYFDNDIRAENCAQVEEGIKKRVQDDPTYADTQVFENVFYLVTSMSSAYQQAFDLTDNQTANMTFMNAYDYSDIVICQMFEGNYQSIEWTSDQILMMKYTQKYGSSFRFTSETRKLYITKLARRAVQRIIQLIGGTSSRNIKGEFINEDYGY